MVVKRRRRSTSRHGQPKSRISPGTRLEFEAALKHAETMLRLNPSSRTSGKNPKWAAVGALNKFIRWRPQQVWLVIRRWGQSDDPDTRAAIATCLLEHLLQYHFQTYIDRVDRLARSDPNFAHTVSFCWKFGQSEKCENSARFDAVIERANIRAREARGRLSARALAVALQRLARRFQ